MSTASRSDMESLIDKLLLLKTIGTAQGRGRLVTIPLQKLVFLSEHRMNERGIKGFSYSFYRDHFGPAAPDIYSDFTQLIDAGLIRDCPFRITSAGRELLEGLHGTFHRSGNREASEIIESVAGSTPIRTQDIKRLVYDMSIELPDGTIRRISDIPFQPRRKILIMKKLAPRECREVFTLTDDEVETLEIAMDPDLRESLRRAEEDARSGRIAPRPAG